MAVLVKFVGGRFAEGSRKRPPRYQQECQQVLCVEIMCTCAFTSAATCINCFHQYVVKHRREGAPGKGLDRRDAAKRAADWDLWLSPPARVLRVVLRE